MTTETAANPADGDAVTLEEAAAIIDPEAQAQAGEPAAEEGQDANQDDDGLDALIGEPSLEDEFAEVEIDGAKYQVPAKIKDGYLREADYRRKTMDLADQRRAVETAKQQHESLARLSQDELHGTAQLISIAQQIEALKKTPIDGWTQEQINAARMDLHDLEKQAGTLHHQLTEAKTQRETAQSEAIAKLREETNAAAGREIPNWSDQYRGELEAFAVSSGIPEGSFKDNAVSMAEYKLLHLANIGHKFVERQRKAASMKAAQAGKPAQTLGGISGGGKAPKDMDPAEMAKHLGY